MINRLFRMALRALHALLRPVFFTMMGALIAVVVFAVIYLNNKPDLSVWHTVFLDEEFSISSGVDSFEDYLKLEDRLFQELEQEIYSKVPESKKTIVNRFNKGSKTDPTVRSQNWNRTFELSVDDPPFGVLLLHGLSDSPYSLRSLGKQMHADGAYVVGLRIPGHGTAPSGLRRTTFEDMAAAVELAMQHMKSKVGNAPVFIVGYSNGGALAVHFTNNSLMDASLTAPAGLILFSPEIGISPAAAYAGVQAWIGERLRLNKLAWNSVEIEFDPYKYNSFALNAGILAYHATQLVSAQLNDLVESGQIGKMPPILAFQSAADATVEAEVLVRELFDKLEAGNHELVIFDVNQVYEAQGLLAKALDVKGLISAEDLAYKVSVVTNKSQKTLATVLHERAAGSPQVDTQDLDASWPLDVYSLAHIALPFTPDDPLYGSMGAGLVDEQDVRLGSLAVHGERNTLLIPISALARQHWNPFYSVVTEKTRAFTSLYAKAEGRVLDPQ